MENVEYRNNEEGLRPRKPVNVYKYFKSSFSVIICLILLMIKIPSFLSMRKRFLISHNERLLNVAF